MNKASVENFVLDKGDQSSTFDEVVLQSPVPVLADFYADWCAPCRFLIPILNKVAENAPFPLRIVKVNVDRLPDLAIRYNILGIPTVIVFNKGKEYGRKVGLAQPDTFLTMLEQAQISSTSTEDKTP